MLYLMHEACQGCGQFLGGRCLLLVRSALKPVLQGFGQAKGGAFPLFRGVHEGNFVTFSRVDHGNLRFRDSQWPHHTGFTSGGVMPPHSTSGPDP